MTDWERVRQDLREEGYSGFKFDSGETAVPGLSGEWVTNEIARERRLKRDKQPLCLQILDAVPGSGGAVATDPGYAPESIRKIADRHGLKVVIVSVSADEVRIALCDSSKRTVSR